MNIEGTIELVSNSAEGFWTSGNIIAIVVALISILGSIFVAWKSEKNSREISKNNNETQKKINDENLALQEKWNSETRQFQQEINQANIDANLIASARIEWIQKVRNTTSELIALYFQVLNTVDEEDLLEMVIKAQEKTELLILFFGHEEERKNQRDIDLVCTINNDNKNSQIVEFLSRLSEKLYQQYKHIKDNKLENLEAIREKRYSEMQNNVTSYDYEEYPDENGNEQAYQVPILDKDFEDSLNDIDQQINDAVNLSKQIENDLLKLRDIIRIYLKIEWNKAKTGT